jgi:hypothetical protein
MRLFRKVYWLAGLLAFAVAFLAVSATTAEAGVGWDMVKKAFKMCAQGALYGASIGCNFGPYACVGGALTGCGIGGLASLF